jgi:hypothetical protein
VTALARWLVMARRLRARPLHRAHVCVRKDARIAQVGSRNYG